MSEGSSGGHKNLRGGGRSDWKKDDGNTFQPKTFIDFGGLMIETYDIRRIEKTEKVDPKADDGITFQILVRFKSPPFDKFLDYRTEAQRDKAYRDFKGKLMVNGINVF